jgi:hypothetical protein
MTTVAAVMQARTAAVTASTVRRRLGFAGAGLGEIASGAAVAAAVVAELVGVAGLGTVIAGARPSVVGEGAGAPVLMKIVGGAWVGAGASATRSVLAQPVRPRIARTAARQPDAYQIML